ncbi:MAG: flagellar hook-length control protein FliK [Desulfuromonadaceae bacterium]|nr:flagellar hook-length control protein FliK [Desulfuromonadaceae bacterium]
MALATDIQQQVYDLLSRASNISFVTADQETGIQTGLSPGQRVTAVVLTTLPNNRTQVQVGGERFNLDLPMPVRPGQTLEMTFVSADPRSTFAISRQGGATPPVSLSDASRLLSLLVSNEQTVDPKFRSSLQNIGDMLRRSSGETGVLANLMDEALTYGVLREGGKGVLQPADDSIRQPGNRQGAEVQQGTRQLTPEQTRLAAFEANASQILKNIAQNSRFVLTEAANLPVTPLPFLPGDEVDATVVGTLPGGRAFVQVAGSTLELQLPRTVQAGEILRLTYISSLPKPTFAIPRSQPDASPASLSEAGRWLSVLEHSSGGVSGQQMYVLERLNNVLKSLPPDSPAFTAIQDEAITYQTVMRGRDTSDGSVEAQASMLTAQRVPNATGNGIVLSDDMAKLLQAVIKGNRLALLEALGQQAMPSGLVPGQLLKGEVMSALGGGRFMVQVAGQMLEFAMPKGIRRGDMINLFFITEEPKDTFLMARFGRLSDSRVSDTGRWLSGFLAASSERVSAQTALNILSTLLSAPPSDASQVSRTLQQGLRESGLFYESHLARWFGGEYALEDLLKEPQGRLSPRILQSAGEQGNSAEKLGQAIIKIISADLMEAAFNQAGTGTAQERIADQRTLPVVSEQLSALQNGQLMLRGDLFPGQRLEWTVAEREAHRNDSGERERSWETSLNLDLPRLGAVGVKLSLDGTLVRMHVRAEDGKTVPLLETGRGVITEQLEAAGLKPVEIIIQNASP